MASTFFDQVRAVPLNVHLKLINELRQKWKSVKVNFFLMKKIAPLTDQNNPVLLYVGMGVNCVHLRKCEDN